MRWSHGWNVLVAAVVFQAVVVGIVFSCFSLWGDALGAGIPRPARPADDRQFRRHAEHRGCLCCSPGRRWIATRCGG